ncbi:D-serine ammonia-lyase [Aureococcus anophagefferens]|nr:D-serine ammonia-lyase [Aureococcus anophagefferens]
MGPCLAKPAASAVSPEKPADASPAPANGDAPPKRQRRPSRTAIENNIDLNDEEQLDRVMMQIMEDPADLADFQAFALDKSSEEEIDLWTDIDEYVKQFAICDDDEGDTDEEKLTRRLEVERMLEKHFCDGGPATKLNIPPELIVDLRKLFDEKNYHTTIWFPLRTALVHDMAMRQLKPYIEHQREIMGTAAGGVKAHANKRREGSRIARKSANARFDSDMHAAMRNARQTISERKANSPRRRMSELKLHKPQRKQVRTRSVKSLRTPNLICYEHVLKANAARMRSRAERLGCELRPHFKTVKTLGAATIATGGTKRKLTVSTLAEAFFLEAGGFDDIVYAVPLTPDKIDDVEDLSCRLEKFYVMVDHMDQLRLRVRRGRALISWPSDNTVAFADKVRRAGFAVPCVGVGSTPTCSNPPEHLDGVDEMHPGNFLYYDTTQLRLGSCASVDDVAVRVITRVGKECGYGAIPKHPELAIVTLKQECGEITTRDGAR